MRKSLAPGPEPRLPTAASEPVRRMSDDFARALGSGPTRHDSRLFPPLGRGPARAPRRSARGERPQAALTPVPQRGRTGSGRIDPGPSRRCGHLYRNRDTAVRISTQAPRPIAFYWPVCGFARPAEASRSWATHDRPWRTDGGLPVARHAGRRPRPESQRPRRASSVQVAGRGCQQIGSSRRRSPCHSAVPWSSQTNSKSASRRGPKVAPGG